MDFVHWHSADPAGATGKLREVDVALVGPMGTAFYLHDDYPNFSGPEFTPSLAATGMVELAGGPAHAFNLSFGAPVQDPVLFLGSMASVLTLPAGTAVTRVSGDADLRVDGNLVSGKAVNAVPGPDGALLPTDSNGTVALSGLFSSIAFTLVPNFGDGSVPDGVFLQVGGAPLSTSEELVSGTIALQSSARDAWRDVNLVARELAERAVTEAASGHAAASAISQRAAWDVVAGAWSNPVAPDGAEPATVAAVAHAQDARRAADAARARVTAYVAGGRAALAHLASIGGSAPPGLADFRDPLAGSVAFCDFDTAGFSTPSPLTFGASDGEWSRGNLRVSVAMGENPSVVMGASLAEGEATIRSAMDDWQQVAREISATPGTGFFSFTHVGTGQEAEIQATWIEPGSFHPPKPPDTSTEAAAESPEHGHVFYNRRRSFPLAKLKYVSLHEAGHLFGLGHSGVPGSLMFPEDSGNLPLDDLARQAFALLYGWLPRRDLADRATSDRPSLHAVRRGDGYAPAMFWRGSLDDEAIWRADWTGDGWSAQRDAGVGTSSHSPGLTAVGDTVAGVEIGSRLLMAWKGPGSSAGLFWSRQTGPDGPFLLSDGTTSHRTQFGTSAAPSLATLGDTTFMVWKGADADRQIWFATLGSSTTNESWSDQSAVPGAQTSHGPALVAWNGRLFLFWKAADGSQVFFSSRGDVPGAPWGPPIEVQYPNHKTGTVMQSIRTDVAPSATARPRDIMLVWKGEAERPLHVSLFDGLSFSGEAPVAQSGTVGAPAVAALPDVPGAADPADPTPGPTIVAWRGNADDRTLHWSRINAV